MALTKIDDRGVKYPLDLLDSEKIRFGTGNDLELYHDGTSSYIVNGTGNLHIRNSGSNHIKIQPNPSAEGIVATANGAVGIYYDGVKKFETNANGVEATGNVDLTGLFHINYASSTNTNYMSSFNNNNGNMVLFRGDGIYVGDNMNTSNQVGGPNNQKIHLDTNGTVKVVDSAKFIAGSGDDLQIYHDGSNSFIPNTTGKLFLRSDTGIVLQDAGGNESFAEFNDNGAVELYYDGTKKFETYSGGTNIPDGAAYTAGDSNDVQLYHHSGASYLTNSTGSLYIRNGGGSTILIQPLDGEDAIKAYGNGRVELAYDHSKKLETTSSGITVTGSINASGLSKASGNMYINNNDTTNGVITFATNTNDRWKIDFSGNLLPAVNNDVNIGSSSYRVANLYVNDMHFANSPENTNSVDGTWGDWTLQEGEENIFMLNNRTGKKYKMALQEVV